MRLLRVSLLVLSVAACSENPFRPNDSSAPTDLTYQLQPSGDANAPLGVLLSWTPPRSGRAVSYDVYGRSATHGSWLLRATTSSPSFHDAGIPQLQYYVQAFDGDGDAMGSSEVVTIDARNQLQAPRSLGSTTLNRGVALDWAANAYTANPSLFSYYSVYSTAWDDARARCDDAQWSLEGTTVSEAFLARNLANGVTRCFAVSAISRDGHESVWSNVIDDTPRYDARNVAVDAADTRAQSSAFLFYDAITRSYGAVAAATDLTAVTRAPATGYASGAFVPQPGYAYVFRIAQPDGVHYGALRVAYVARDFVVFDWSYQSAVGNPELSRGAP